MADGFHDKTGKVWHKTQECFNGEVNGGCEVVCCFATPSNARGRHSQVIFNRKSPGFCRAKSIAVARQGPRGRQDPNRINAGRRAKRVMPDWILMLPPRPGSFRERRT